MNNYIDFYEDIELEQITSFNESHNKEQVAEIVEVADKLTEGYFKLRGNPLDAPYTLINNDINWHVTPNGDREGMFSLNVFGYLEPLMKAYQYTKDEKYTKRFIWLVTDWIDKCPAPNDGLEHFRDYSPWRSLEAGRRMRYWIPAYSIFRRSPLWNDEIDVKFTRSVYEHCRHLGEHIYDITHNHTIMHMEGLLYASTCFYSFDRSKEWLDIAVNTLHDCAKNQIRKDGTHFEAIPNYHLLSFDLFFRPLQFMIKHKLSYEEEFYLLIAKMIDYIYYIYRPDGTCTPIGDSSTTSQYTRDYIATIAYYFYGDERFYANASKTETVVWVMPSIMTKTKADVEIHKEQGIKKMKAFDDGGFYCIQSDLSDERLYAMFHCGPLVHGHPHADLLSMDIFAYGKSLLTDVGIYTYNECTSRRYLKGTQAHNTAVVDGYDQAEYQNRMAFKTIPDYRVIDYADKGLYQYVDAEHYGYCRLEEPVTHRRKFMMVDNCFYIVIDQFTGEGEHDIEFFWHFDSTTVTIDQHTLEAQTNDKDVSNIKIIPLSEIEMKGEVFQSWISQAYGTKKVADVAKYWIKSKMPISIVTAIIPQKANEESIVKVEKNSIDMDTKHFIIHVDNQAYQIDNSDKIHVVKL